MPNSKIAKKPFLKFFHESVDFNVSAQKKADKANSTLDPLQQVGNRVLGPGSCYNYTRAPYLKNISASGGLSLRPVAGYPGYRHRGGPRSCPLCPKLMTRALRADA